MAKLNEPDMIIEAIMDTIPELGPDGIMGYLSGVCARMAEDTSSESQRAYWNKCAAIIENTVEQMPQDPRN